MKRDIRLTLRARDYGEIVLTRIEWAMLAPSDERAQKWIDSARDWTRLAVGFANQALGKETE